MKLKEIYLKSKEDLKGNWWKLILIYIIFIVISQLIFTGLNFIFTGEFRSYIPTSDIDFLGKLMKFLIVCIIIFIFYFGLSKIYLDISNRKKILIKNLFYGFKKFSRVFEMEFVAGILVFLWSLLFIIPGIIKSVSYSFRHYILIENPEISPEDAIFLSGDMTKGKKIKILKCYFYSFKKMWAVILIQFLILGGLLIKYSLKYRSLVNNLKDYKPEDIWSVIIILVATFIMAVLSIFQFIYSVQGIFYFKTSHAHIYNEAKEELNSEKI